VFGDPPPVAIAIMEVGSGVYHSKCDTNTAAPPLLRVADLVSLSGALVDDMVAQENWPRRLLRRT
jgi:hypothetical protein